jgi:VanZ family protein
LLFRAYFQTYTKKLPENKIFLLAVGTTILFAMSDEFHQTFVPTREGAIRDVFIDTIGILIAFSYTKTYLSKLKKYI